MAKAVRKSAVRSAGRPSNTTFAQVAQFVALTSAAYVLDIAGYLDSDTESRLKKIHALRKMSWRAEVEARHGVTRAFLQNLYAVMLDRYLPHEAIPFILRGLGFVNPERTVEQIMELKSGEIPKPNISLRRSPTRASRNK